MSNFKTSLKTGAREFLSLQHDDTVEVFENTTLYVFDSTSSETDDDDTILKPYDVRLDAAGRLVKQYQYATNE